jgi:hypothetical protein
MNEEEVFIKYKLTMTASGGEDAILILLWRQNEGGAEKNFSRQDAKLYYLTAAVTFGIPPLPS